MMMLSSAIIVVSSLLFHVVVLVDGQPKACTAAEVQSDTCIFRIDGECDNNLAPFCTAGTDCYDCDPCLAFAKDCATCTAQSNCGWCKTGTSGIDFCLSAGFMEAMPGLCSEDGGTEWNVGSCSAIAPTAPTVIVPSPPSVAPPVMSPARPTATIGSYECDFENDSCLYPYDDVCDAGTPFCKAGSDCFDCDPCQALRLGGCKACTAAGCLWCGAEALCLSASTGVLVPASVSCRAADFVTTCDALESTDDDQFSDPLRESQNWAFEQVNIKAAWDMGYTGKGVGIRVNDDGVDSVHPEFAGRFVTASSCTLYRPVSNEEKHGHGTAVASLAVGSGTDGGCGVGMAPGASLSACRVVLTDLGEDLTPESEDDSFLYLKMDGMDISQNSYGSHICSSLDGSDDMVRRRRTFFRRLQGNAACPFSSPTVCGSCSTVDWSNPKTKAGTVCEQTIIAYCNDILRYQSDASSCASFLDLFVTCEYNGLDPGTSISLERGIQRGRDGKGIIFVYASGNDYDNGADTNFEGTLVSRYTIAVGATGRDGRQALYSTGGAALFVSAPGGDLDNYANHFAAAPGGGCRGIGPGTSFSSPLVSGIIALMLEANPALTWRDVQGILATTSRRLDENDKSWIVNGAGLHHSYLYGFGVVDAGAAVKAAQSWPLYSAERQIMADSGTVALAIPDFPSDAVTSTITVTNSDFIVESVNVYLDLVHASRGHLEIVLVSPNGTESLLNPGPRPENSQIEGKWKLKTVRAWGEMANGVWSLRMIDRKAGNVADCVDLGGWELEVGSFELTCGLLQQLEVCSNGGEGSQFDVIFDSSVSLTSDALASADGVTPGVACCACGGGEPAANVANVLQSWQLVLYGRTVGDTVPGRITTGPVPGPSPTLTVPTFPTAVQQPGGTGPADLAPPEGLDSGSISGAAILRPKHWGLSMLLLLFGGMWCAGAILTIIL